MPTIAIRPGIGILGATPAERERFARRLGQPVPHRPRADPGHLIQARSGLQETCAGFLAEWRAIRRRGKG